MLPDRVSNPGPLTYESGALPIALRGLAIHSCNKVSIVVAVVKASKQISLHEINAFHK